jgi:hypothetical protein
MEATLRVQLNSPAFLQYLNEAAAQSTLSPRGKSSALVSSGRMRDRRLEGSSVPISTSCMAMCLYGYVYDSLYGYVYGQSGKKRDFGLGRNDSKKSVKTSPGSPVASARVSPAPPESRNTIAEAHGTKDAAPISARDGKQVSPFIKLERLRCTFVGLRQAACRSVISLSVVRCGVRGLGAGRCAVSAAGGGCAIRASGAGDEITGSQGEGTQGDGKAVSM